jgi:thioredoxin reductase (NADPH)
MSDPNTADVAIIGAGPIGLEMAVALKKAGIDYLHFDAKQIGYTISWFAPGTRFFSSNERIAIAGVPLQTPDQGKSTREQYLAYLRCVVEQFDLAVKTYEPVIKIERAGIGRGDIERDGNGRAETGHDKISRADIEHYKTGRPDIEHDNIGSAEIGYDKIGRTGIEHDAAHFRLTTRACGGEHVYAVSKIVLATGGTDRPRRLGIPGETLPHVSNYFTDPHAYFRKDLLIVGGKNSAVEAALRCHAAGARVAISYRREALPEKSIKYWLMPEIAGLIESGKIKAHFPTTPAEILPGAVRLAGADGSIIEAPADFVLMLIGYEADMSVCRLAGVELTGDCSAPVFNPQTMETNVPGIFVAGTVTGGTQERYTVFIENCHVHVQRILAALTARPAPAAPKAFARPES